MPRVTVVMATYNWSTVLPYSIASALEQTFRDFELRVVGDCCTDDTADVVAAIEDPRVSFVNLPTNSGHQFAPNNEGIRQSDSEYIAYLGHDDLWLPHHLAVLVAAAEASRGIGGVAHGSALLPMPDVVGLPYPRAFWKYQPDQWLPPTVVLHSRSLVDIAGGWRSFRDTGKTRAETDLWARLSDAAARRPIWVKDVTAVKLTSSARQNVYRDRPHHEQQEWLERIRRGERWSHLIRTYPRRFPRDAIRGIAHRWGRESWVLRWRGDSERLLTEEQRWELRQRRRGLVDN